jgi:hyperosmotically inducible periplasmic protein
MRKTTLLLACLLSAAVAFGSTGLATAAEDAATAPDNTKMNKQESMTADQQKESPSDRKITQKIRQAIVKNKTISQYAHNVKIITVNGAVTLKGPVRTEKEKKIVENAATKVAGNGKVTSEIEVAPAK